MDESILTTIKQMLGLEADYDVYDKDVIVLINSAFSVLCQLGLNSHTQFSINSNEQTWGDFLNDDHLLAMVKEYIYLKCRIVFDPPQSSFVLQALKEEIDQLEWRMKIGNEFLPIAPEETADEEEDDYGL